MFIGQNLTTASSMIGKRVTALSNEGRNVEGIVNRATIDVRGYLAGADDTQNTEDSEDAGNLKNSGLAFRNMMLVRQFLVRELSIDNDRVGVLWSVSRVPVTVRNRRTLPNGPIPGWA